MAASFFTEDYRLGTVSGSAGSYERGQEKEEGREEVARFPGIVVGSASEVESEPILAWGALHSENDFVYPATATRLRAKGSAP